MTARDRTPIVHSPGVLTIPLTRGLFALIDESDAPLVAQHRWCALRGKHTFYACRRVGGRKARLTIMHKVLIPRARFVDHIDGDGLNNRRSNLRPATNQENSWNARVRTRNTSGFRGVYWSTRDKRWKAQARHGGTVRNIGGFATKEDAARAYDAFVLATRGEFAVLNFPHARSPDC